MNIMTLGCIHHIQHSKRSIYLRSPAPLNIDPFAKINILLMYNLRHNIWLFIHMNVKVKFVFRKNCNDTIDQFGISMALNTNCLSVKNYHIIYSFCQLISIMNHKNIQATHNDLLILLLLLLLFTNHKSYPPWLPKRFLQSSCCSELLCSNKIFETGRLFIFCYKWANPKYCTKERHPL